jgi:hypothetical protein
MTEHFLKNADATMPDKLAVKYFLSVV